jgi:Transcription factor WhiB
VLVVNARRILSNDVRLLSAAVVAAFRKRSGIFAESQSTEFVTGLHVVSLLTGADGPSVAREAYGDKSDEWLLQHAQNFEANVAMLIRAIGAQAFRAAVLDEMSTLRQQSEAPLAAVTKSSTAPAKSPAPRPKSTATVLAASRAKQQATLKTLELAERGGNCVDDTAAMNTDNPGAMQLCNACRVADSCRALGIIRAEPGIYGGLGTAERGELRWRITRNGAFSVVRGASIIVAELTPSI